MSERQIKIIASFVVSEWKLKKTEEGRKNYLERMSTMMDMCGADIHYYNEMIAKYMPQMQMEI